MKKRLLMGVLSLSVLLAGCSSLLDRDYNSITPHNAVPTTEGDPSTLRADSYQELVNALLYFVSGGMEEGTVRLYTDTENVEPFLANACLEIVQEDPLGAYCVEFIKYGVNPVVTYSEADIHITYRRTREQVASIIQATGVTAIRGELESALASFATERVLRISYFGEDEDFIRDLARQAYCGVPTCALGMPEIDLAVYPDSGRQRIVEILLRYPLERSELERRRDELGLELRELAQSLTDGGRTVRAEEAAQALLERGTFDPQGSSTPYDFFQTGSADSEGLTLAYAALCQTLELPCQVARGTRDGEPRFWAVVQTGAGWRHLDLVGMDEPEEEEEREPLYTDQQLQALGYDWDGASLPACTE